MLIFICLHCAYAIESVYAYAYADALAYAYAYAYAYEFAYTCAYADADAGVHACAYRQCRKQTKRANGALGGPRWPGPHWPTGARPISDHFFIVSFCTLA